MIDILRYDIKQVIKSTRWRIKYKKSYSRTDFRCLKVINNYFNSFMKWENWGRLKIFSYNLILIFLFEKLEYFMRLEKWDFLNNFSICYL